MTPDFKEAPISQIPALRFLQQLGYGYLSPEETAVERKGKLGRVLLEDTLARQLHRLNRISFKGKEVPFSQENIAKAIEALRDIPFEGLVPHQREDLRPADARQEPRPEHRRRDQGLHPALHRLGEPAEQHLPRHRRIRGGAQTAATRPGGRTSCASSTASRFGVIECKRPDLKHSLEEAVKQNLRNQQDDEIPQLFIHAQLLLALNKNGGSYATTGTPLKFWAKWREMHEVRDQVHAAVNSPIRPEDHAKLFKGLFAFAKEEIEEQAMQPREPTGQDFLLWSLCRPERLIELARQFIVYDEGGAVKKIARYQQYFAIRSTLERVRQRDPQGRRKGGVIWQTQGSGKSLAMVLLGKALALEKSIPNARVVIVTDRVDLDGQIWKTFHQCGKEPQQAKTGAHLIQLLRDERAGVITTLIQKFGAAAKEAKNFKIEDGNLFVLVDESHRSQYGEANILMQKALPKACYIGFTGTPLMKEEKSTAGSSAASSSPPTPSATRWRTRPWCHCSTRAATSCRRSTRRRSTNGLNGSPATGPMHRRSS